MTQALCLGCGGLKLGALTECLRCGAGPTGQDELDILFSDHYMALVSLKQFGEAIRTLHEATPDPELRTYVFVLYVEPMYPGLMQIQADPSRIEEARLVLESTGLQPFEVQPGIRNRPKSPPDTRKRWWQFWRHGSNE